MKSKSQLRREAIQSEVAEKQKAYQEQLKKDAEQSLKDVQGCAQAPLLNHYERPYYSEPELPEYIRRELKSFLTFVEDSITSASSAIVSVDENFSRTEARRLLKRRLRDFLVRS